MSQFPVETGDIKSIADGVNYLLSGPGGLGQNFQGFSTYAQGYLTGNFRPPFADATLAELYVAPIDLGVSELLDPYTWKFNFDVTQTSVPFVPGQPVSVIGVSVPGGNYPNLSDLTVSGTKALTTEAISYSGVSVITVSGSGSGMTAEVILEATASEPYDLYTDNYNTSIYKISYGNGLYAAGDVLKILGTAIGGTSPANDLTFTVNAVSSDFDGDYSPIGVVQCTTDYVICRTDSAYSIPANGAGGKVLYYNTLREGSGSTLSTDANGKVLVNGAGDRVFLSSQLNSIISYIDASATNFRYTVQINRLKGFINNDPINPEYRFNPDATIAEKVYDFELTGSSSLANIETIFTAIIDNPDPGYYWYILEVQYKNMDWDGTGTVPAFQITTSEFAQRGLSAQVVKQ